MSIMQIQSKAHTISRTSESEQNFHEQVRKLLCEDHVGYVLVTCRKTKQAGKLEVEVSYDGDPDLACYLTEGAQSYFQHEFPGGE
jgi:hypothetical protein